MKLCSYLALIVISRSLYCHAMDFEDYYYAQLAAHAHSRPPDPLADTDEILSFFDREPHEPHEQQQLEQETHFPMEQDKAATNSRAQLNHYEQYQVGGRNVVPQSHEHLQQQQLQQGTYFPKHHQAAASSQAQLYHSEDQVSVMNNVTPANTIQVEPLQLNYYTLPFIVPDALTLTKDDYEVSLRNIYASILEPSTQRYWFTKDTLHAQCKRFREDEHALAKSLTGDIEQNRNARGTIRRSHLRSGWWKLEQNRETWYKYFTQKRIPEFASYQTRAKENPKIQTTFPCFLLFVEMINQFVVRDEKPAGMFDNTNELTRACQLFWRVYDDQLPICFARCPDFPIEENRLKIHTRINKYGDLPADHLATVWNFIEFWMAESWPELLVNISMELKNYEILPNVKSFFNNLFANSICFASHTIERYLAIIH